MGCVLGTRAAGETGTATRRRGGNGRRRRIGQRRPGTEVVGVQKQGEGKERTAEFPAREPDRRKQTAAILEYSLRNITATNQQGWPTWLVAVAGDAIKDWTPRRANTFEKLDKIGQGTYSNVYKAKDLITGKIVALKKVRFDNLEPESLKFMAREILVLSKLDHPNVIKLEGLVTSRMSSSLYLVFEYMEHDLAGLSAGQEIKFTEPQVKCYMHQLLSGLEHCHNNGVLHRDIKCSNLLIDNEGNLKIADFGLASFYDPEQKQPMTSRVVTLWYRPPELLLGATSYGVGVDLWSAGCILAELLAGKPIMPGRTEVEQLHKIFKLCGSPSEEYWKKSRLPNATLFKPQQPYKRCISETFKDFPPSSLPLIETLLAIDPKDRGTATAALNSNFFTTEPFACNPLSLPKYPPSKEIDLKLRDEEARRQRGLSGKPHAVDGARRVRARDRISRAVPAPEANAENQANLDRWRMMTEANAKSKSEKFPPPHQDAAVGYPLDNSNNGPLSFNVADNSFNSSIFDPKSSRSLKNTAATGGPSRRRIKKEEPQMVPSRGIFNAFLPSTVRLSMDLRFKKESASEIFGRQK
ncbi:probable serine/threonine-protein kinase At1g54610 [Coffea arabica]|uniref:Probable serine/threonine-protein kinase At1g54610 n=1 Tax=Coffea arabica TaxID=13443 RepID=A0A6P6XHW4_COFAR|nr:probable serine/threonine-protein kinase At1g54610 [Coffea arabica]